MWGQLIVVVLVLSGCAPCDEDHVSRMRRTLERSLVMSRADLDNESHRANKRCQFHNEDMEVRGEKTTLTINICSRPFPPTPTPRCEKRERGDRGSPSGVGGPQAGKREREEKIEKGEERGGGGVLSGGTPGGLGGLSGAREWGVGGRGWVGGGRGWGQGWVAGIVVGLPATKKTLDGNGNMR
ncbi:hypothetical protein TIFTF001_020068 [Ficus carica]|uniref:Uncharacterized protein n=1 Tax=Ficus carica TaxID=3494 RepID=A0AA88D9H3_FICCA|nr:hypothetical protein TIFTF001_020068 [Ficus carica]